MRGEKIFKREIFAVSASSTVTSVVSEANVPRACCKIISKSLTGPA